MANSRSTASSMPELAINAAFSALLCIGLIAALVGSRSDTSDAEQAGVFYAGLSLASASVLGLASRLLTQSRPRRILHMLAGAGITLSSVLFWKYAPGGEVLGIIAATSWGVSIALQFATAKPFRSALIASAITGSLVISFVLLKEKPDRILSWEIIVAWVMAFLLSTPLSVLSLVLAFDLSSRRSRT